MIQTLYARLALTLAVVLGLVGLVYLIFTTTIVQKNTQHAEQILNRDLAKTLVAERNLIHENILNEQALKGLFQMYMDVNPSIEIYLLDLQGKILSYSADPGHVQREYVSLQPIKTFLNADAMFPVLGDDPRALTKQKVFSVTPIPNAEQPNGYLYVILRGEEYDHNEQLARDKELLHLGGWVVGIALLMGLLLGLLVFYPITKRLKILSKQVDDFRKSKFETLPVLKVTQAKDELSQLESNIALMAEQTVQQFKQISEQDIQRRDLFASLSHDLRTPLATLHSYLETLQIKANDLTAVQRDEYTERSIQFSNRLKELVDELFEMAKLDMLNAAPLVEAFSLPELVQDVLQQFEAKAKQAGVGLHMVGDTSLPFVSADIALMQRVFENLIENALRHVKTGGSITVCLAATTDGIKIEVTDTGCGMAADVLDKIFEPLYQVNNKHRGGEHAGLGLAVVKRILELHGSAIRVRSDVGKGSTFVFDLGTVPDN